MRTRAFSSAFKRDYRKIKVSPRYRDIDELLGPVVRLLIADKPLPSQFTIIRSKANGAAIAIAMSVPTSC